jgi:hypothetical protein
MRQINFVSQTSSLLQEELSLPPSHKKKEWFLDGRQLFFGIVEEAKANAQYF